MSTTEKSKDANKTAPNILYGNLLLFGLAPLVAAGVTVLFVDRPLWVLAAAAAATVAFSLLRRPDAATFLVIFILYTNSADVAVSFHGVPKLVGLSFTLLLLVPLVHYIFVRREPVILAPALPLVLLYFAIGVISALCSMWPEVAMRSAMTFLYEGVAIYFLFTNLIRTPRMLRGAIWTLLAAGVLIGGVPLYQQITGTFRNNYGGFAQITSRGFHADDEAAANNVRQARLSGSIGEQNRYAQIMLMLVPLGLGCFWSERNGRLKALAVLAICFAAGGAVVAFSRGAAVAFVLTFLIAACLGYISRKQTAAILFGGLLALAAMPQYWTRLASFDVLTRIAASENEDIDAADGGARNRVQAMGAAALVFLDYPLTGVGPGMFRYYCAEYGHRFDIESRALEGTRQSHNLLVDVAAETGIFGLIVGISIIVLTLRRLAKARKKCRHSHPELFAISTGLLLALTIYLTTGIFLHFAFIRYFWLIMALAAAAAHIAETASQNEPLELR